MPGHALEAYAMLALFAKCRRETLRRLGMAARPCAAGAGEILLREGEAASPLYILLHGQVELLGIRHERETVLAIISPVAPFVLADVILETPALMSARTLGASELLAIPAATVRKAMSEDPGLSAGVARELSAGYSATLRALKQQKLCSGVERLADHLLSLRANAHDHSPAVTLRHEKRVLASLLGMTPENLSRAFAALRDYGVSVQGALVRLENPAALQALARSGPTSAPNERSVDGDG